MKKPIKTKHPFQQITRSIEPQMETELENLKYYITMMHLENTVNLYATLVNSDDKTHKEYSYAFNEKGSD